MTINDQIRDEKLQYDINREAAKISALSLGKIHKYKYLTVEVILPSNQQQIIEGAEFTYSSLAKAFEKQIKTIGDQGEKQKKDQGQVRTIKKCTYDVEDPPLISKQKEAFNELLDERIEKINNLDKKINSDDLIYRYKGRTADAKFDKFDNPLDIRNKIRNGKTSLTDVENNQAKFKSNLSEVKKNTQSKKVEQKSKKAPCIILKCFTKQGMRLLNFMMIILQ